MNHLQLRDGVNALRVRHVLQDGETNDKFDIMFLDLAIELMIKRKYDVIEAHRDEVPELRVSLLD